jgi:hypothetical protein
VCSVSLGVDPSAVSLSPPGSLHPNPVDAIRIHQVFLNEL